jgi:integrase/recombinase XerD
MTRRRIGLRRNVLSDPTEPGSMATLVHAYLDWMLVTNHSQHTVVFRDEALNYLVKWCRERGITQAAEINKLVLERFQRYLYHCRKRDGAPLSFRTQYARLSVVRAFFKWCARHNHLLYNPASELELPKWEKRLPKHVLTVAETETVMRMPDLSTSVGIRDRAIMETLYSSGMRRMEISNLKLYDIDRERGTLLIRQGKGKKDRMLPIGDRALAWVLKYMNEVRPRFATEPDAGWLWLTPTGDNVLPATLGTFVSDYVRMSGIGKLGGCHMFRHTMATLMLEGGADVRFIQAMLGHAKLDTTEIYTHVSIRKLKEVHSLTHPAKMEHHAQPGAAAAPTVETILPEDTTAVTLPPDPEQEREELLATLAAEAEDDDLPM